MTALVFGAQVERHDEVGYVLAYVEDEHSGGTTDLRIFHVTSDGEPAESRSRAAGSGWSPTGKMAGPVMVARMQAWQAEQELLDVIGSMESARRAADPSEQATTATNALVKPPQQGRAAVTTKRWRTMSGRTCTSTSSKTSA